jgi:tetratricopeptide (TPR) repeat protein
MISFSSGRSGRDLSIRISFSNFRTSFVFCSPDFHWTNRIASCLFDLGEYEQAIEWQRKAWFISAPAIADFIWS